MEKESNNRGGIVLCGVLAIIFIVLKLTNLIDWSWWWVLCPLWGWFVILLACLFLYFITRIL